MAYYPFPLSIEVVASNDIFSINLQHVSYCRICQLNQLINEPTRVTPHSSTLIDLILTSNYIANLRSGVMPIGFSDHCLIFLVVKGKNPMLYSKICKFRSFRNFNESEFQEDLRNQNWAEFNEENVEVDKMWSNIKSVFTILSDKHAPFISVRRKRNGVPWITDEYITLARDRDYYKKRYKKTKCDFCWENFKFYRNKANNLNKNLERAYDKNEFSECGNDLSKNWKVLKKLLPSRQKEVSNTILIDEEIITDKVKVASLLNETFNNVSSNIQTGTCFSIVDDNFNSLQTLSQTNFSFEFQEIKSEFVRNELRNIDCKKAIGMDGLYPK